MVVKFSQCNTLTSSIEILIRMIDRGVYEEETIGYGSILHRTGSVLTEIP